MTTACETKVSNPTLPRLECYSREFANRVADELKDASHISCARDDLAPPELCSAARRAIRDYLTLRDRIKEGRAKAGLDREPCPPDLTGNPPPPTSPPPGGSRQKVPPPLDQPPVSPMQTKAGAVAMPPRLRFVSQLSANCQPIGPYSIAIPAT